MKPGASLATLDDYEDPGTTIDTGDSTDETGRKEVLVRDPYRCPWQPATLDDRWSGILPAGKHILETWNFDKDGPGDMRLGVRAHEFEDPPPVPTPSRVVGTLLRPDGAAGNARHEYGVEHTVETGREDYVHRLKLAEAMDVTVAVTSRENEFRCFFAGTVAEYCSRDPDDPNRYVWTGVLVKGVYSVEAWEVRGRAGSYEFEVFGNPVQTPGLPEPPVLTVTAASTTHSLSWTVPESDAAIRHYFVDYRSEGTSPRNSVTPGFLTGNTHSRTVPIGTRIQYRVRAVSVAGSSDWSSEVSGYVPLPFIIAVGPVLSGWADTNRDWLRWAVPATSSPILHYEVQRSNDGGAWTATGTYTGASLRVTWPSDPPDERRYRVRAVTSAGSGYWSTVLALAPATL